MILPAGLTGWFAPLQYDSYDSVTTGLTGWFDPSLLVGHSSQCCGLFYLCRSREPLPPLAILLFLPPLSYQVQGDSASLGHPAFTLFSACTGPGFLLLPWPSCPCLHFCWRAIPAGALASFACTGPGSLSLPWPSCSISLFCFHRSKDPQHPLAILPWLLSLLVGHSS